MKGGGYRATLGLLVLPCCSQGCTSVQAPPALPCVAQGSAVKRISAGSSAVIAHELGLPTTQCLAYD